MTMPLRGLGPPDDTGVREVSTGDDHHYAMWDAAYVLGALSAADRREFEAHLAGCPECRGPSPNSAGCPPCCPSSIVTKWPRLANPPRLWWLRGCRRSCCRRCWRRCTASAPYPADHLGGLVRRCRGAGDRCASRCAGPLRGTAAGGRVGAADGPGRHAAVGVHGVDQRRALGTFINLRCVCLAPPYASRHAGHGCGGS